ncbi:hypothetical protein QNA24_29930 [Rhodococcus qingshengii]|uniref:hypothetical protein n=1 Tax=Rhodococcus TaxID=1827 RepID=UPI001E57FF56|nr:MULTISPECIES: hypothetical protein [Rhodococcus]MCD2099589.1 hypothetical protein [Rhodococcus rhodochrous]MCD2123957.1 hypothetical protein [Rhodococcus rhodochrous]MCQ4136612.1 hypothetical protein [Rhodococcus rhodochrous]MDJ0490603.1 hypothetical protein [Rhodococcus qingshengii]
MSQDLRRERAGAQFETIAGATNYIAELEQENFRLRLALSYADKFTSFDEDVRLVVQSALNARDV